MSFTIPDPDHQSRLRDSFAAQPFLAMLTHVRCQPMSEQEAAP